MGTPPLIRPAPLRLQISDLLALLWLPLLLMLAGGSGGRAELASRAATLREDVEDLAPSDAEASSSFFSSTASSENERKRGNIGQ